MPLLERAKFGDGRRIHFEQWLHRELFDTQGNRHDLESRWEDELERWRSQQPEGSKSFPFEGASNLKIPTTAMHADPILADLMSTLHADDNFWNVQPRRGDSIAGANAWREALKYLDDDFLQMREVNERGQLTNLIHGTAFYKSHWLHEVKQVRDYNLAGEIEKQRKVKSHPIVDHVPLQNIYFPPEAWHLDADKQGGAQWVAERFELRPNQLRARAQEDGLFEPRYDPELTDFVIETATERNEEEPVEDKIREQADFEPFRDTKIELFEVWARFDVDGDGIDEDVQVIWNQRTQTILRALHNPFLHGKRPFEAINYLPTQGIYGIGVAEATEWLQKTISRLVNAQVDNVLLANTRMFSAPLGSAIQPGEPIYPNKVWFHGPNEEVKAFQAGEVYPSLFQTISQFMEFGEQRTGASETFQGNVTGLPSRTPASTTLSLLQQGSKRFNMILANMRQPLGRVGLRVMQNVAQYFREDPVKWQLYFNNILGEDQAADLVEQMQRPIHDIESGFNVTLLATSAKTSPEAEKQQFVQMLSTVSQIYPQLLQTAQLIEQLPPQSIASETAQKAYSAGVELLEQLLNRFEVQNPSEFLPDMQAFEAQQAQAQRQAAQQGISPQFGALGGPQGAGPLAQGASVLGQSFGLSGQGQ